MRGFIRNLKYWLYVLEKQFLIMIALIFGMSVLLAAMDGDKFVAEFTRVLPRYFLVISTMVIFMQSFMNCNQFYGNSIIFSGTRKMSTITMVISMHIMVLQYVVIGILIYKYAQPEVMEAVMRILPGALGIVVLILATGFLVQFTTVQFGGKWGLVAYFGIVIVFVVVILCSINNIRGVISPQESLFKLMEGPVILLVAVALDAGSILLTYIAYRKYEVRV